MMCSPAYAATVHPPPFPPIQFQVGACTSRWLMRKPGWHVVADQYSQARLGRFYAELAGGSSVDEASQSTLQLSEAELTAGWRAYLVRLAQY